MKIELLKKIRLLAAMGGIVACTAILSGCGAKTAEFGQGDEVLSDEKNVDDEVELIPSEYLNDKGNFDKHKHIIVEIGGITYIFRGCQPEFSKVSLSDGTARILYYVYDANGEILINGYASDYSWLNINTYLEEQAAQEIESDLIENGARLYKGLGN